MLNFKLVFVLASFSFPPAWTFSTYVLRDLGCWRDTANRAIPSIDDRLLGPYASRPNAIQQCAHEAATLGHSVFAVQHGGWCASASNALSTYKTYGPSSSCNSDGKGGPWANQVYKLESVYKVSYRAVGCFKDQSNRAIDPIEGRFVELHGRYQDRTDAINKCARAVASLGHAVFAVQNGGWCASTANANETYDTYGYSQDCLADGKGGPWANAVYEITAVTEISLHRRGCWMDTANRALPLLERPEVLAGTYGSRPNAIEQCIRYAAGFGHPFVGIQNGGACMAGIDFGKYGTSTACKTDSKGGPWANEVFELTVVKLDIPVPSLPWDNHYFLTNLGCWTDTEDRAIPISLEDDTFLIGGYGNRNDAVQRCAQAAASRGYDIIGVQNGGQCWSGSRARNSYRKYGKGNSCNDDGEGGAWANQVYEINNVYHPIFTGIGCFRDTANRAIPTIEGFRPSLSEAAYQRRTDAIRKCAVAASSLEFGAFAVQNGGWCASSSTAMSTYRMYGQADNCSPQGKGGAWANSVYRILDIGRFRIRDMGCWADDAFRTIPTVEGENPEFMAHSEYRTREDAIAKCARYARSRGFTYFAIQHGGWCATSVDAELTYMRIGPSTGCASNGKGGPWANQVYEIWTK